MKMNRWCPAGGWVDVAVEGRELLIAATLQGRPAVAFPLWKRHSFEKASDSIRDVTTAVSYQARTFRKVQGQRVP